MRSELDVIVVTYRSAGDIEACLASIPSDAGIHTVVVENASGDDTPAIARRLGVRVVENATNDGFARAANQGAGLGTAPAILFLNPDAILAPDTIDRMLAELDDPSVAVVGTKLRYPDGSDQRWWWSFPGPTDEWAEAFGLKRVLPEPKAGFVVGACFLVRRSAFEALGGFDERFWLYAEEADLCKRATDAGLRVVLARDAVCHHQSGASGRESSELVAEHFALGSERFVLKHHGPNGLASYRLAALVGSAARWPALRVLRPDDQRVAVRSRQIRRTARVLVRHPRSLGKVERPDQPWGRTIVVLSLEPWDEVWRRNQLICEQLLQADPTLRILWVAPPIDLLHEARRHSRFPGWHAPIVTAVPGIDRVLTFQPRKLLPRRVWPFTDRLLARRVRQVMRAEGFADATLWVNDTTYVPLVRSLANPAVYDITDDWLDASGEERELVRRRANEADLLALADAVIVCSPELERRRSETRLVTLIPNAVDAEHFRRPRPRPADLPRGKVAVYVGTLHDDRIDVGVIEATARANAEAHLVLVGPQLLSEHSTRRLEALGNVLLLGPRPYADVPAYLQHADVVIVPHVCSPFTASLDPIKAYECLAVGRPTLSTPVAGFSGLGDPVRVTEPEDFPDALMKLLEEDHATVTVPVPSWAERAAAFEAVLRGAETSTEEPSKKRRKVVYLGHTAIDSGAEIALARLVPGLAHSDVHVILGEDGPLVERLREVGATVEVLPMADEARTVNRNEVQPGRLPIAAARSTAAYVLALRRRLRELRPDVVHTNSLKSSLYGGVAARAAGKPVVWHVRDRIADDYLPRPAVIAIRALSCVLPNALIANSGATLETLGEGHRPGLRAVVHDPLPASSLEAEASSSDEHGPLTVTIVGRIAPWKGQDVVLRAFAAAFPTGDERLMVVGAPLFGETDFEAELHRLAEELGIAERVVFTGHVTDVPARLAASDIVVHASVTPEPFGQVIVEAMAAGRAVIASAAGGPLEIIDDGADGLLVTPGDVEALAGALAALATGAERRARLGAEAAKRAAAFAPRRLGPLVERLDRRLVR